MNDIILSDNMLFTLDSKMVCRHKVRGHGYGQWSKLFSSSLASIKTICMLGYSVTLHNNARARILQGNVIRVLLLVLLRAGAVHNTDWCTIHTVLTGMVSGDQFQNYLLLEP